MSGIPGWLQQLHLDALEAEFDADTRSGWHRATALRYARERADAAVARAAGDDIRGALREAHGDTSGWWVYWLCDKKGNPIYIGKTGDLLRRLSVHYREKKFTSTKEFRCGDPAAADALERRMIATHDPPLNKQRWAPVPLG